MDVPAEVVDHLAEKLGVADTSALKAGFACGGRAVQASYVISLKGLVVTLGMVLGDFSSRASTRER